VYVAARSEEKANAAITSLKADHVDSKGALIYLHLDLADLTTIKASADSFLSRETQLHVLFNNAGVMTPPAGSRTAQGYELQLGANCLGSFLFTKLLTPVLISTAKALAHAPGAVRVVWVSSSAAEATSPTHGVPMEKIDHYAKNDGAPLSRGARYGVSKAGNWYHATEFARRYTASSGVVSVALNPGNLKSDLTRSSSAAEKWILENFVQYPVINGAYTELFAGLSSEVTVEKSGAWSKCPC